MITTDELKKALALQCYITNTLVNLKATDTGTYNPVDQTTIILMLNYSRYIEDFIHKTIDNTIQQ